MYHTQNLIPWSNPYPHYPKGNIVGKRENDGNQHFLLISSLCFLPNQIQIPSFILFSAYTFILDSFPKQQTSDFSQLEEYANDNFKFEKKKKKTG